ncbi:MAG TPA: type VI secretion system baseplate subunit TssG [Bryobacteraceae bacterium]|nr:type VI secretion system baseplate subunit TssG [Bryobacteraceae bacterium]
MNTAVPEETTMTAAPPANRVRDQLEQRMYDEPWAFAFFQAVRLMKLLSPERHTPGGYGNPAEETVRFTSHPSVSFPASEIQSLEKQIDAPPLMCVNFMGVFGPLGILPVVYTQFIRERVRSGDRTLRDFLDIFNHRMVSLFYRAWEKYRFGVPYERGERDRLTQYLFDFVGLGTPGLENRLAVPDQSLLFYTGLLAQQPRSAEALRHLLEDYFDVPVEVFQFRGVWRQLDVETQCSLDDSQRVSSMLGVGVVAGDEVWDQQSVVRVRIGPLNVARYLDFLPTGTGHQPLRALTRFFSQDNLDFEVQLVLRREDAPLCELGAGGDTAPRLGWLTWGMTRILDRDPDETVLELWRVN